MIYQLPDRFLIGGRFFMRKYRLRHLFIACCCCILLTVVVIRPKTAPEYTKTSQTDEVRVYFSPSPACENNIIAAISKSQQIDVAVYSITNHNIVNTLIAAYERGARIRIVTDRTQANGKYSLVDKLRGAGIAVRIHKGYNIEHNKFAVFDNNYVVTGSYNWTTGATKHNSENCIFLSQPVQEYKQRFETLWSKYGS